MPNATASTLRVGMIAPPFKLPDDRGRSVSLRDHRGRIVVLFFYPEDGSPGCTTEAAEFRDQWPGFRAIGAVVLGVSPDSVASHRAFRRELGLPFPLLSDPDHTVATRYGAWGAKTLYGRKYVGLIRSTCVIDTRGRVAGIFTNVRTRGHAVRTLAWLEEAAL